MIVVWTVVMSGQAGLVEPAHSDAVSIIRAFFIWDGAFSVPFRLVLSRVERQLFKVAVEVMRRPG